MIYYQLLIAMQNHPMLIELSYRDESEGQVQLDILAKSTEVWVRLTGLRISDMQPMSLVIRRDEILWYGISRLDKPNSVPYSPPSTVWQLQ